MRVSVQDSVMVTLVYEQLLYTTATKALLGVTKLFAAAHLHINPPKPMRKILVLPYVLCGRVVANQNRSFSGIFCFFLRRLSVLPTP